MEKPQTKEFSTILGKFDFQNDLLLVTGSDNHSDDGVYKSARNLDKVTVLPVAGLNVYDILKHQNLALTKAAIDEVMKRLG
jgi:large subunit ribosomal protein L4